MIENPHDLHVIAVALRGAIALNESHPNGNIKAVAAYRETLEKVERLQAAWRLRQQVPSQRGG
jgi:hypothetical protein